MESMPINYIRPRNVLEYHYIIKYSVQYRIL